MRNKRNYHCALTFEHSCFVEDVTQKPHSTKQLEKNMP